MAESTTPLRDGETTETEDVTDGFNLVIDALKLNEINTIYNVPEDGHANVY